MEKKAIKKIILIPNYILSSVFSFLKVPLIKNRVGIINLPNLQNIGNILVKFAMFKKIEELGFNATLIIPKYKLEPINPDISFLNRTIKSHLLLIDHSFYELNENDYDFLMVNSDQTWAFYETKFFYNVALLKFAKNWKAKKFIYATSMGTYHWKFKKEDNILFKNLLKNFTSISFREKGMVKILEDQIGLKSFFVLDPTFLIDKKYYLNEIKNYKSLYKKEDKFIFVYQLDKNEMLEKIIKIASEKFNLKIYKLQLYKNDYIESFIYGIYNSKAVITDSFHGTAFSINFNKPFISFLNEGRGKARFTSLKEVFHLDDRIIEPSEYSKININLLLEPLHINQTLLSELKIFSNNFIKKNLGII